MLNNLSNVKGKKKCEKKLNNWDKNKLLEINFVLISSFIHLFISLIAFI